MALALPSATHCWRCHRTQQSPAHLCCQRHRTKETPARTVSVSWLSSSHCECVLVEQVSNSFHIQLQELIHLVHLCEVLMYEVISCRLQLWTVQALRQDTDTCNTTTPPGGSATNNFPTFANP
ncbi:hypothetical protein JZ751_013399 [Albula glossodonta]|uniref:Uncharacterized protein n=1 Tax=Albula glossodonta TaxID=121402 RepID=A0A8T2N3U7_9TELE|nr:hypothetical protein JZ751_013399 [Albula glossodonta]